MKNFILSVNFNKKRVATFWFSIFWTIAFLVAIQRVTIAQCQGIHITNPSSLIPNTSFDERNCCPDNVTDTGDQMACIKHHIQASYATIDYHVVNCGNSLNNGCITHAPTGTSNDNGILGMVNSSGWKEYLGTCLLGDLIPGVEYTLRFKVGFGASKGTCVTSNGETFLSDAYTPFTIALFATADCSSLPFAGTGCPPANWTLLREQTLSGQDEWVQGEMKFTVTETMEAIVFGPNCAPTGNLVGYYYIDDLILNETNAFNPELDLNVDGHPCSGLSLSVDNQAGFTYKWFYNNDLISGATTASYSIPLGQEGHYFVRVHLNGECVESNTFFYEVPAFETFLDEEFCFGESLVIGNQNFDQTGNYQAMLTTSNGCDSTVYLNLLIRDELLLEHQENGKILCTGGTVEVLLLSNASNPNYVWADAANGAIRDLSAGSHEVIVIDDFSCQSEPYTFGLEEPDSLASEFLLTDETCIDYQDGTAMPIIDGGTEPYSLRFIEESTFQTYWDSFLYTDLAPGIYGMEVKDSNACLHLNHFEILPRDTVHVSIQAVASLPIGDSSALSVSTEPLIDVATWHWMGNDLTCDTCAQAFFYPQTPPFNQYRVLLTEADVGCVYEASTVVKITDGIYIANIFAANEDGFNDRFYLQSNPENIVEVEAFYIYDRWGEQLFQQHNFPTNAMQYGWDGTFNGQKMPVGVYVYFAKIKLVNGMLVIKKGSITLLR